MDAKFCVGDQVEKFTGDYQLTGEVRASFYTTTGKLRYVVEHSPGFLHIYSEDNLRPYDVMKAVQDWLQAGK